MSYVLGALVGVLLGSAVGCLKNIFVWRRYLKKAEEKNDAKGLQTSAIYIRAGINYGIDILTLILAFILGGFSLIDRTAVLIGTAVVLSILSIALILKYQRSMIRRQGGGQL